MAGSKEPLSRPQRPLEEGPPRGLALDPQHPRLRRQLERAHACAPKLSALLVKKGVVQMETEGVLPGNRRRAPATCGPSCFLPALGGPQHRGNVVSNRDTRVHILGPEDLLHTCIVWRGDRSKPFSPSDSALSPILDPRILHSVRFFTLGFCTQSDSDPESSARLWPFSAPDPIIRMSLLPLAGPLVGDTCPGPGRIRAERSHQGSPLNAMRTGLANPPPPPSHPLSAYFDELGDGPLCACACACAMRRDMMWE